MPTRVINAGHWERTTSGQRNTSKSKALGEIGTVTAIYEGQTYTFGPGESKVLENGIAAGVIAFNSALRVADERDQSKTARS